MKASAAASNAAVVVLAVGIATAMNLVTLASIWDAFTSSEPGLSENATQVLTTLGGGILGVLGAAVGYKAGAATAVPPTPDIERSFDQGGTPAAPQNRTDVRGGATGGDDTR